MDTMSPDQTPKQSKRYVLVISIFMHVVKSPLRIPLPYTIEAANDFRSSLRDVFDCTGRANLPPCIVGVSLIIFHGRGCPAIGAITLSETDETCPFMTQITICVGIQDLSSCRASVADVTRAKHIGRCRLWVVEWDEGFR